MENRNVVKNKNVIFIQILKNRKMNEYQLINLINGAHYEIIKILPKDLINENEIINDLSFVKLMRFLRENNYGVGRLISICNYIDTTKEPINFDYLLNHLNFDEDPPIKTELNNCVCILKQFEYIKIHDDRTITKNESFDSLNNYFNY